MMSQPAALALLSCLVLAAPSVRADDIRETPSVVLELFTSQGCPNSPPADALFSRLAGRRDVIALAYHVNYWDYVGWKDTFAKPESTDLQRDYSQLLGNRGLYTPQLVIDGTTDAVGSDQSAIDRAIASSRLDRSVDLTVADGAFTVKIAADPGASSATVWLVTFRTRASVAIERGDNQGKTLEYANIVTERRAVAMLETGEGVFLKFPLADVLDGTDTGAAILVQEDRDGLPGQIRGAASFQR